MEFSVARLFEAVSAALPDGECLVHRERRLTFGQLADRSRRLAAVLRGSGLGVSRERAALHGWESGQDHLALYLYNGTEYLEGMLGGYGARVAPFNVNYRYVEDELLYLLRDARARAIVYHASFAPRLAGIRDQLPDLRVLLQVADGSGRALLPGALDYEQALGAAEPTPMIAGSPDDLYILYTGGTTGMPKGVLWRQADIYVAGFGGHRRDRSEYASEDEVVEAARTRRPYRVLPAPPFMHGAAHWTAFSALLSGHAVVLQRDTTRLDPRDVLSTIEREGVTQLVIVGDAFARPLLDEIERGSYDLGSLRLLVTGGAALHAAAKQAFLERLPGLRIVDSIGSSESGLQAQNISVPGRRASTGNFLPEPQTCVLSDDLARELGPGDDEIGWFAKRGRVPLGYLGDAEKTERTFPTVAGVRYSVPGDRARRRVDGSIDVHGRDSVTINSGGEKIFAEEVEHALKAHASVYDAVVVGRPSERWGQEVVALVHLREGAAPDARALLETCGQHLARYKLPKEIVFLDHITRSPSGKADYRWAREQLESRTRR